ncbi:hypothetical protein GALMADRAFT_215246 [Galerina marginata CBS 339.88]|uniref:Uncharacterized protein n=1 Tax=Galerina marginata (strain CBS 339.88) TaxID=685588 RepID=A0A067SNE4_GALM3|nr:hypothetical protein GALMADRAFT_215246 [Galerina marginata CBS 339.88]
MQGNQDRCLFRQLLPYGIFESRIGKVFDRNIVIKVDRDSPSSFTTYINGRFISTLESDIVRRNEDSCIEASSTSIIPTRQIAVTLTIFDQEERELADAYAKAIRNPRGDVWTLMRKRCKQLWMRQRKRSRRTVQKAYNPVTTPGYYFLRLYLAKRLPVLTQRILAFFPFETEDTSPSRIKCREIETPAGPPPSFSTAERVKGGSDRWVPGTPPTLLRNAKIWTGARNGTEVVYRDDPLDRGVIVAVGYLPPNLVERTRRNNGGQEVKLVDAGGKWITPGNIDGLNTHDDACKLVVAGGVTRTQILPGSADYVVQVAKLRYQTVAYRRPFCHVQDTAAVKTHTDNTAKHAWTPCGTSATHTTKHSRSEAGHWVGLVEEGKEENFPKDLQWESLVDVLRGRVKLSIHCYEAVGLDGIARLSNEFKFTFASFHPLERLIFFLTYLRRPGKKREIYRDPNSSLVCSQNMWGLLEFEQGTVKAVFNLEPEQMTVFIEYGRIVSSDIMATLLELKSEYQNATGKTLQLTFSGGSEAHLLAKEIASAGVSVILTSPRPYPGTWEQRRILPGPPLSKQSSLLALLNAGVNVAIGVVDESSARNTRFEVAWAALESNGTMTRAQAIALASSNLSLTQGAGFEVIKFLPS